MSLAAICSRLVRKPDQCPFQSGLMLGCKLSGTLGEVLDPKLSSFTYLFSQHLLTFVVLAVLSLQSVTEQNGLNTSKYEAGFLKVFIYLEHVNIFIFIPYIFEFI